MKSPQHHLDVKMKLPQGYLGRILSAILVLIVLGSFIWVLNVENLPESETQPTETQSRQSGFAVTSAPMQILGVRK